MVKINYKDTAEQIALSVFWEDKYGKVYARSDNLDLTVEEITRNCTDINKNKRLRQ